MDPTSPRSDFAVIVPAYDEVENIAPLFEALPDDATAGDPHVIEVLREAARGAFRKIDGVVVDGTTAAAILTVYDTATPATRAKLTGLRLDRMAAVAWRLLRPHV